MRVFIYEAITAGAGWGQDAHQPSSDGLLAEGLAMLRAVTEDFAVIEGVEIWGLRDERLAGFRLPRKEVVVHSALSERAEFERLANLCDWALVIAPELEGMLSERVGWLQGATAKLLSPSGEFLAIASSKSRTAERLHSHGVPVPLTVGVPPSGGFQEPPKGGTPARSGTPTFPLVLKRDDGAGSVGMRFIRNRKELEASILENCRLEQFCPGLPASVAVLCGPAGNVALQPCEQRLDPGTFEYLGGNTPLPPNLAKRAKTLAIAAIEAMSPTTGYVGVDLVLGEAANGSQDVIIEINPRLTTSYIGLRRACQQNLAQAMLDVAAGRLVDLCFGGERVEFRADGSSM